MITDIGQLDFDQKYSYAEYLTWQFRERVELINGLLYPMERSGGTRHQQVCGSLLFFIHTYLKQTKKGQIFSIPFDVRLSKKHNLPTHHQVDTVVEPDLSIICDPSKLDDLGCNGSPDWIIEIFSFSESMNKKDTTIKLSLYESVGIREYWIVDPFKNLVTAYCLDQHGEYQPTRINPFVEGEMVPVGVFDFEVDLGAVFG